MTDIDNRFVLESLNYFGKVMSVEIKILNVFTLTCMPYFYIAHKLKGHYTVISIRKNIYIYLSIDVNISKRIIPGEKCIKQ